MTSPVLRFSTGSCSAAALALALISGTAHAQATSETPAPQMNPSDVQPGKDTPSVANEAQTQQAVTQTDAPTQDVVVTGFRSSLAKALDQKRTESAAVDSILAEDIGKFPDLNLSESIQRIPGVALARDGGEGRTISVRGLGPQFTRVRINGLEALATAGGADSSGGANRGRGFDFNVFASDLFNAITVRKTADPSTEEGSLGATVDLRTARPFDYKKFTIAASGQADYNDLHKKWEPRGAAMISDVSDDGRFGALLSVAYTKREIEEDGFSTVRWAEGSAFAPGFESALGSTCVPANANGSAGAIPKTPSADCATANSALHPRFPRYDQYIDKQERLGITGSIQFAPTPNTLISIDGLYADFKATREERYLEAPSFSVANANGCTAANRPTNCGIADTNITSATYTPTGAAPQYAQNILTKGTFDDVDLRVENRFDRLDTKFKQLTVEGTQKFGEQVSLEVLGGISQSVFTNPVQNTLTFDQYNVDGYSYDYTNPRNPVFNFGTAKLTDPTAWALTQIRLRSLATKNDYKTIQANLTWKLNPEFDVLVGGEYKAYDFKTTELRRSNGTTSSLDTTIPAAIAAVPLSQYGQTVALGPTNVFIPNYFAGDALFNFASPTAYNGAFRLGPEPALTSNNSVGERDKAGYVQFNFRHEFGDGITVRGDGGLRYVSTSQTANGFAILNGALIANTSKRTYEDYLPSFNLVIEPLKNLVFRIAAAKVVARPDLGSLPPGGSVSVSGSTRSVSFGNPNLDPYRAGAYDMALEWYFMPGGLLSMAVFQKDINSFVTTATSVGTFTGNSFGLPDSLAIAACGSAYPSTCNPASNNWSFSVPVNSPGGRLRGLEANLQLPFRFLPSLLKNTGVLLNYTHVNSDIQYVNAQLVTIARGNLTGLSPNSGNATFYYEDKLISARVSGAYRSAYLTRIPGQEVGTISEGTNETFNLDTSVQITLTKQVKLTFEGINLTDQYQDQYVDPGNLMVTYHHTGREFLAGVRFNL